jgi:hypothetical protein
MNRRRQGWAVLTAAIYAAATWFAVEAYRRADTALYGLRRMNDAYSGPIAKIERADDKSTLDIGAVDDMRQFCARTTCIVRTMYDQSGGGTHLNKVD